ncbi:MAG TPA: hypothetical protein VMW52_01995 [Phycisphaerae bacterium]|nr:hypothetical protein [Phycisphaerae bacterium]
MTIAVGNITSIGTAGWWKDSDVDVSVPSTPTISVIDDESGSSCTVTIDGDPGVTNYVYYGLNTNFAWSAGGNRSGDGTVQIGSLTDNERYLVIAVSKSPAGVYSLPSDPATVRVTSGGPSQMALDIADAVVSELNAGSWSQSFTAERMYHPVHKLADMDTLHVTVVPAGATREIDTRGSNRGSYDVDIGVQKKYQAETAAELDPLVDLVEEFEEYFLARRFDDPDVLCTASETSPVYSHEHMEQHRQFTAILTLTFRALE